MRGIVTIVLKPDILDPQGRAVRDSLKSLDFNEVEDVRIGKSIEVKMNETSRDEAEALLRRMCKSILVNPVIEDFQIEIREG